MPHEQHGHGHGHGHDYGHDYGHGHGRRSGWWHRLRHLLTPHSHDSADRVDASLETSRKGLRTLALSFGVLLVTALAQLAVVVLSGSVALLGDTIHNFADALTAVPLWIAFLLGRRAATRRFTYGFGRAEDLAGLVVVLLIAASAALAGYEAMWRLIRPELVEHLPVVAAAGVIGFLGNELVARYRIRVGREIGSAALVADGLHARTDGFTSLAVVLGALGVGLGFPAADPIIGLLITVAICFVLRDAAREVFGRLMDAVDPATVGLAERTAAEVAGVAKVDQLRMRWIGHKLHAELAVAVDPELPVGAAHELAHEVEHALLHAVPRLVSAVVHTEPWAGAGEAHERREHHR
ncbi:cation diffusion facilitator family transporter [Amycolatopsis cihanbeyliensis]|uniref:Cation diffusion facilitator family transporter n=1 Tax=Amycolatopsis cihanbeyliensis TaxID=1128664 RepID=A0A542DNC6_AMYCI|nr:cation diffusion facilitator family transporter [Amycolatopsis cihanbeyliensis]TQJ04598.1 cation diffusion facilitator family transporter [Amycolatopsis cihanbeyliensis]